MKRLSRKAAWGAIVCASAATVFAGCANDAGEEAPSQTSPTAGEQTPAGETKEEPRGKVSVTIYDRGKVPPEEGTIDNNRWTKWINENGPVDATFVPIPRGDSVEKLNVLLASGDVPDIILEFDKGFRDQMYTQNLLLPLDDLIEEHSVQYKALLEQYPALKKVNTRDDGNMYGFGRVNGSRPGNVLFIRQDWLDRLNLPTPQTTEELFEVAKAFAEQDPDGNGQDDTYGLSLSHITGWLINQMFGDTGWIIDDTDNMVQAWDRMEASMAFKKRLFDAGIVDKDYLTDGNGEKAKQDWINGKLGIYGALNGVLENSGYPLLEALKTNVPTAKIVPLPFPESPFGRFSPQPSNPVQTTTVLYRGAEDPVAAIKFIDFMVTEENFMTMRYGIEGEHWKTGANGCPEYIDRAKYEKEVLWTEDFVNFASRIMLGKCQEPEATMDLDDPMDKEFYDIVTAARAAYMDPSRPYAGVTHDEHYPQLPDDIQIISSDLSAQITELQAKAIVGGPSYTAEMAMNDVRQIWEKGNGKRIEDFYAAWYKDNKDNALLTKDLYDMATSYE